MCFLDRLSFYLPIFPMSLLTRVSILYSILSGINNGIPIFFYFTFFHILSQTHYLHLFNHFISLLSLGDFPPQGFFKHHANDASLNPDLLSELWTGISNLFDISIWILNIFKMSFFYCSSHQLLQ